MSSVPAAWARPIARWRARTSASARRRAPAAGSSPPAASRCAVASDWRGGGGERRGCHGQGRPAASGAATGEKRLLPRHAPQFGWHALRIAPMLVAARPTLRATLAALGQPLRRASIHSATSRASSALAGARTTASLICAGGGAANGKAAHQRQLPAAGRPGCRAAGPQAGGAAGARGSRRRSGSGGGGSLTSIGALASSRFCCLRLMGPSLPLGTPPCGGGRLAPVPPNCCCCCCCP